jgi:glycerophosphoryl diester phosphodiesterase
MIDKIHLVGHRGQPDAFPENSLESFSHALNSAAAYIETDVNVSADGIVVLSHDENLKKLTGKDISITKNAYSTFSDIPAGYQEKFFDQFTHCRIATLAQFSELLKNWPDTTCFIELKQDSLACFGNKMVDLVMSELQPIATQAVLISFDYPALVYAREKYRCPVGWVLPEWSLQNKVKAEKLSPEYLFVDKEFCPEDKDQLWPGDWQWVVYTVNTFDEIKKYADLGISIIETDCLSELQQALDASAVDEGSPQ